MSFDTYLWIEGIEGEATAAELKPAGQTELYSFSWGASNPSTIGTGTTGAGAGKVSVSSFNFMKKTDKASPSLFQACCAGKHFPKAKVTMRKAGGDVPVEYLIYEFEEVFVDSVQWSGSSGGDDTPTESVSLAFGKVKMTYSPQDVKGTGTGPVAGGWDLTTNHAVA
jgi:type VI secretion system secreted protein Hcp